MPKPRAHGRKKPHGMHDEAGAHPGPHGGGSGSRWLRAAVPTRIAARTGTAHPWLGPATTRVASTSVVPQPARFVGCLDAPFRGRPLVVLSVPDRLAVGRRVGATGACHKRSGRGPSMPRSWWPSSAAVRRIVVSSRAALPMSQDLHPRDRPEGEEEPWVDPPNCPVCEAEGRPGYPLVKLDGKCWCRRHQGFVELSPSPEVESGSER